MNSTRVLVFRTAALGDFIMSLPALRAIRADFGCASVSLLTAQGSARDKVAAYAGAGQAPWVALAQPHLVDEVVVLGSLRDVQGMLALRRRLRECRFQAAILLCERGTPYRSRLKKWLLLRFLLGGVPIYGWRAKGSLRRSPALLEENGLLGHHVDGMFQYRREAFPDKSPEQDHIVFDIQPGPEAEAWASGWLRDRGWENRRLIGVAPGALQPHKKWPEAKFGELLRALLGAYPDVVIVIVGTSADRELGGRLCLSDASRMENLAGASSIPQSAALMGKMALLVGNDGGAMHLGDAAGCRVVSIMPGIEYPYSVEPRQNVALAVRHPVECAPCYNFVECPRGDYRCMAELSVDAVFARCRAVLGGDAPGCTGEKERGGG